MLTLKDLRGYQQRAIEFVLSRDWSGLFLDMGLGKTIIVLTAVRELILRKRAKRFLLIGPIRVIEQVWRQEAQKWEHTQRIKISLVRGSPKLRDATLREHAHIYMINPELVQWLVEWMKVHGCPFDGLIVDESSMFKNPSARRWKSLRVALHMFNIRMILTGTPQPNSLLELWPQIYLLDRGERLGTAFYRFRERFFETDYLGYNWTPRKGAAETIRQLISDIVLRLDAKDWLDIPPIVTNRVDIELDEFRQEEYRKFEKEMLLELETGNIEALNPATLTMRCHQLANGAIYDLDDMGQRIDVNRYTVFHDYKLEAIQEIVAETGDPIIIAYNFRHDLDRLQQVFPDAPVLGGKQKGKTEHIVAEFAAGKHPVLLAHPQSASHGLNDLETCCSTIAFYSLTWSLEQHDQLIARIGGARAAKHGRPTVVHYVVAKDTVDEAILDALQSKDRSQRATLNALRAYSKDPLLY